MTRNRMFITGANFAICDILRSFDKHLPCEEYDWTQ